MLKVVPLGLRVWGQLRLTGLFKRLESVEKRNAAGVDRDRLLSELDQIDQVSARMFVPRAIVQDYVDFRQFVHDMRERVASGEG